MIKINHKKLINIIFYLIISCILGGLIVFALNKNLDLYFTPHDILQKNIPKYKVVKIGALVKKSSIRYHKNKNEVEFKIYDGRSEILVKYRGVLPDLFKEEQKIIVKGRFDDNDNFIAKQVLAKHDEVYKPADKK